MSKYFMRVRYSFSSRRTRRTENIRKQRPKFPDVLEKVIENSDIVLEVLDSRFVEETRNKEVEEFVKESGKKLIYVLNKSDLKELKKSELKDLSPYVVVSCRLRRGGKALRDKIKYLASKLKKDIVNVGVVGYPNTGKSSVINLLVGKSSAKTGAEAGFTKGLQKLKLSSGIRLFDSPGVIPKKEYSSVDSKAISKHVKVGARTHKIKDPELVVSNLMKEYAKAFEKYYKIKSKGDSEHFLEKLGQKKNFLKKGGKIDFDKTSRFVLKDWQDGKICL